ncbi:MAG: hypothetical protein P8P56_11170 [Yoonia sp.]|nr:hypothetical protein [Yoonia sp.]MDG1862360.1 hypothetical protein [Yoonia sp.]
MSEIDSLQGRITAALDRIGAGVSQLAKTAPAAESSAVADADALRGQLQEERSANAQLEERVRVLKERQDSNIAKLEKRVETQAATLATLDAELQRLRASNADLREMNAQLRSAASDGATSPELINRATIAEVEALAAQRAADVAEIDAIITELKPLIEEA